MEVTKQVIFKLGEEEYGFDIMIVNAIETYSGIVPVPNAPDNILGILDLRGEVIPVYSLRLKFGLPETENSSAQLIVTKSNGMMVGFKVDSVHEIIEIAASQLSEVPAIVKSKATKYAKSVANIDGRMAILLDHDGMLNSEEHDAFSKMLESHTN